MRTRISALRVFVPRVLVLAGLVLCGSALRADVIFSNFGVSQSYAFGSGVNVADGSKDYSVAEQFTPGASYDLTSIEFVATTQDASTSVTVGIYADNSGVPDATALESLTYTQAGGLGTLGSLVPVISVSSVLNPELLAGATYWLVMDGDPSESLFWDQNSSGTFGLVETNGTPGNWLVDPNPNSGETNGVFEIDGRLDSSGPTIPEPGAWTLMAGGLAVLLLRRRAALTGK